MSLSIEPTERLTLYGDTVNRDTAYLFIEMKVMDGWSVLLHPFPAMNEEREPVWGFLLHKFF